MEKATERAKTVYRLLENINFGADSSDENLDEINALLQLATIKTPEEINLSKVLRLLYNHDRDVFSSFLVATNLQHLALFTNGALLANLLEINREATLRWTDGTFRASRIADATDSEGTNTPVTPRI